MEFSTLHSRFHRRMIKIIKKNKIKNIWYSTHLFYSYHQLVIMLRDHPRNILTRTILYEAWTVLKRGSELIKRCTILQSTPFWKLQMRVSPIAQMSAPFASYVILSHCSSFFFLLVYRFHFWLSDCF